MHWLIAEDEADIRNLVAAMCKAWGHTTLTFESGQKVWDWLDEVEAGSVNSLPDFALMDIRMPGYRGDEVAKRIRQTEALGNIPIVLMTAFVLTEDEKYKMQAVSGVDHIINKPLPEFSELKRLLEEIINSRQN